MIRSFLSKNYGKATKRLVNRDKFITWASTQDIADNTALTTLYREGYHLTVVPAQYTEAVKVYFTPAQARAIEKASVAAGMSRPALVRDAISEILGLN